MAMSLDDRDYMNRHCEAMTACERGLRPKQARHRMNNVAK